MVIRKTPTKTTQKTTTAQGKYKQITCAYVTLKKRKLEEKSSI